MRRLIRRARDEQCGASTVIVALCMTVLLVVVALVVDIGATAARKAQLQDAADAAALAIAQLCYEDEATTTIRGCAMTPEEAAAVANPIANETVFGGIEQTSTAISFPADTTAPNARETVVVTLTSAQAALFAFDRDATDVLASATAEWRQTVPLPLAVSECVLPPDDAVGPQFIGTGLYTGVRDLLSGVVGNLGAADLPDYLENVLNCSISLLAGGWMGTPSGECRYDPQLLISTLGSTLMRVLPVFPDMCLTAMQDLVGKRIIVPTFDQALVTTVDQLIGQPGSITFTEIVVTGHEFDGLLASGPPAQFPTGGPRCAQNLFDLLGVSESGLDGLLREIGRQGLLDILNLPGVSILADLLRLPALVSIVADLLGGLLGLLTPLTDIVADVTSVLSSILGLCQGVQGHVVATGLTADEAAERIATPVRLVA